jgi:hypothetical protein
MQAAQAIERRFKRTKRSSCQADAKPAAGTVLKLPTVRHTNASTQRQLGKCCGFGKGRIASYLEEWPGTAANVEPCVQ